LVVIDRVAAEECVALHALKTAPVEHLGAAQGQLAPRSVAVPLAHAEVLAEYRDALAAVGVDLAPADGTRFALRAVPSLLERADIEVVLREVSAALAVEGASESAHDTIARVLARHVARLADDAPSAYAQQALLA